MLELICNKNEITSLNNLPNSLIELHCHNNNLTELPDLPNSLELLNCNINKLTELVELPNSLKKIFCCFNNLTKLPNLPNSLETLDCQDNNLKELPNLKAAFFVSFLPDQSWCGFLQQAGNASNPLGSAGTSSARYPNREIAAFRVARLVLSERYFRMIFCSSTKTVTRITPFSNFNPSSKILLHVPQTVDVAMVSVTTLFCALISCIPNRTKKARIIFFMLLDFIAHS